MKFKDKGFTLMELITALAILSILMAVAYPSSKKIYKRYVLSKGIQSVFNTLSLAKMTAASNLQTVSVEFDTNAKSWTAFVDDGPTDLNAANGIYEPGDGETLIESGTLSALIEIYDVSFSGSLNSGDSIQFNERGFPLRIKSGSTILYTGQVVLRAKIDGEGWYYKRVSVGAGGDCTIEKSNNGSDYYE